MTQKLLYTILFFHTFCLFGSERSVQVLHQITKRPIENVHVAIDFRPEGSFFEVVTNSEGKATFKESGACKISISDSDSLQSFAKVYTVRDKEIIIYLLPKSISQTDVVVSTGNPFQRPLSENPYLTRVITAEKIQQMGAQNLSDLLTNEVNMAVGQDAVLGSSVIMQGIGGQGIKILINGIPVIGRLNGNVDVSQILLNNVERVEIIDGPMSVLYGTDALGGVINIITKNPKSKFWNIQANSFQDNLKNTNFDISFSTAIHKKISLGIDAGRYFFEGLDFDKTNRRFDWKPKTKYFANANLIYSRSKNSIHRFSSNFYSENLTDRSDAYVNLYSVTGFNSHFITLRWDNQLHSIFKFSRDRKFEWQNAVNTYSRIKNTNLRDLVTGNETPVYLDGVDTTKFNLINSRGIFSQKKHGSKWAWFGGFDLTREYGFGKRIPSQNPGITDLAVFFSAEYAIANNLLLKPSIRSIYNSRFGEELGRSNIKMGPLVPSFQLKYNITQRFSLRGSYSRGYRAPSIKELFFLFVDINHNIYGNENLRPETSNNFIVNLDYRHELKEGKNVVFNFGWFSNIIENKIILAQRNVNLAEYTYINIGVFRTKGFNLLTEYKSKKMSFSLSSSLIQVDDVYEKHDTFFGSAYVLIQMGANASYFFQKKSGWSINYLSRLTGEQRGYTETGETYSIDGYYLADLTAQKIFKSFTFLNKRLRCNANLTFGIKNLLNIGSLNTSLRNTNTPHSGGSEFLLVSPGRSVFARLTLNIGKEIK